MKTALILTLFLFVGVLSYSQNSVPQGINYQAVVRNNVGTILTNTVVGFKFDIYNSSSLGTPIYSELHATISTGSAGVATCTIGSGTPSSGSFFSNINWAGGDVWYQTYLIINSTTYPIGFAQKFQTVPYAFYAGKAPSTFSLSGNTLYSVGGSTVTLPTSTGTLSATTPTIIGQGLAFVNPTTANNFTVSVPSPTLNYTTGSNTLSISSGTTISNIITLSSGVSITPTITGQGIAVVSPTTGNTFAVNVPSPTLSYNSTSQVLTLTQGSSVTSQTLTSTLTSTSTTSMISILGTGIASVSPTSGTSFTVDVPIPLLSINGNTLTIVQGTNTSNSVAIPDILWKQTGNNLFPNNVSSWIGIGTAAPMGKLDIVATGSLTSDLRISNNSSTTEGPNIFLNGANKSWSIIGTNGGSSSGPNKLVFRDYTLAQDRMVIDGAGNVGIGTVIPGNKLMVEENTTNNSNAAIFGLNNATSLSNNAHGVFGSSNSIHLLSAGVYGQSTGNGSAIFGEKTSGLSGSAGRFILQTPNSSYIYPAVYVEKTGVSSPSPAFYAETNGTGAAVYAKTTNSLALEVNEGHIKSSQATAPTLSVVSASTYFSTFTAVCTSCTDVKGNVSFGNGTTNFITTGPIEFTINIKFNKSYTTIPIVVMKENSVSIDCFRSYVLNITTDGFDVKYLYYCAGGYFDIPIKFNYIVIE